jgi:hypothetical protein
VTRVDRALPLDDKCAAKADFLTSPDGAADPPGWHRPIQGRIDVAGIAR